MFINPLPDDKILDSSKLKEFADNNFKFVKNGRKLSKQVENTVGKGEIACYEQFLLFPQCFQKACFLGASKGVIVWEWVKTMSVLKLRIFNYLPNEKIMDWTKFADDILNEAEMSDIGKETLWEKEKKLPTSLQFCHLL